MIIDSTTYKLSENNFIVEGTSKNRIIIGSTYCIGMKHYNGWVHRYNGKYKKTAMFTVALNGKIYEHFSPNYYSEYMMDKKLNEDSITILLENEGWLIKDLLTENQYINYIGNIYNREDSVVEKSWRNQKFWAPFTSKQIKSTIELTKKLCENFQIPIEAISHNTNFDEAYDFNGILYKSNFKKYYTDISPAWDCELFKNKLEKKDKKND